MGSKNKKGSKAPYNSADEAKIKIEELKGTIESAKEERKEFAKNNGLSLKADNFAANSTDKKNGKKWDAMTKIIETARAEKETAEAWLKENKPKKESVERVTKYEYPDGLSDLEKKKFRAVARAKAKADLKAEAKVEKKKEAGKEDKKKSASAPVEEPKKDKKKAVKKED